MIFQEKRCFLSELFGEEVKVGWYAVIEPFIIPAAKVKFNGEEIETPEFKTPETKLYCIDKKDGITQLMFDGAMFNMSIGPFKDDKAVIFKNSFLKKYLKKVFKPLFCQMYDLQKKSIKCDIPSKYEIFGDDNGEGQLDWFKEIKHRLACYEEYSRWWWTSTKYSDDSEDASAAPFCIVRLNGYAYYSDASNASLYVRPRFVIGAQAQD